MRFLGPSPLRVPWPPSPHLPIPEVERPLDDGEGKVRGTGEPPSFKRHRRGAGRLFCAAWDVAIWADPKAVGCSAAGQVSTSLLRIRGR